MQLGLKIIPSITQQILLGFNKPVNDNILTALSRTKDKQGLPVWAF